MNLAFTVTQKELFEILLNIAPVRPVFIWGAPGIGKSALVQKFADEVGMECVSLFGSQLAPEDIIGIPRISGETSEFLPPKMIAKKEPYVLFLDELNACSQEVQKAFYSLIHEHRIGEYHLPEGSVVIGAGNRSQDGSCAAGGGYGTVAGLGLRKCSASLGDRLYKSASGSSFQRTAQERGTLFYAQKLAYA